MVIFGGTNQTRSSIAVGMKKVCLDAFPLFDLTFEKEFHTVTLDESSDWIYACGGLSYTSKQCLKLDLKAGDQGRSIIIP